MLNISNLPLYNFISNRKYENIFVLAFEGPLSNTCPPTFQEKHQRSQTCADLNIEDKQWENLILKQHC